MNHFFMALLLFLIGIVSAKASCFTEMALDSKSITPHTKVRIIKKAEYAQLEESHIREHAEKCVDYILALLSDNVSIKSKFFVEDNIIDLPTVYELTADGAHLNGSELVFDIFTRLRKIQANDKSQIKFFVEELENDDYLIRITNKKYENINLENL